MHGELDGKWLLYYENGQIAVEAEYKEGKKWNGTFVDYYENGQIRSEENYKDGERNGSKFVTIWEMRLIVRKMNRNPPSPSY